MKTKKAHKQNDKKKGGAKKPSKKSKKTRKNIKGGKPKISKNDVTISIDEDPVTNDDMMFIEDKKFKWKCFNGEINEDNDKKDFDCKIKPKKKKLFHRVTGKKYNRNENITRRIAVGAEYKPGGMDLVLQNYKSDNKLNDQYWNCGCKGADEGVVDEDDDIDLNCFCDVLDVKEDGDPTVERWTIDDNDEDDEPSDSEYGPYESEDRLREKLESSKKELNRVDRELDACYETAHNNKECAGFEKEYDSIKERKEELELELESTRGGGVKNTKKSKLSKLKSLIKDYERVIKKYSNKLIKFKSKDVSKDKSLNKSKKLSKKKSKKYTKKNTKK